MRPAPTEFWSNEGEYASEACPALTPETLRMAEQYFRVTLPKSYIAFLAVRNGGYTRRFIFPSQQRTSWHPDYVGLDCMSGIGPRLPKHSWDTCDRLHDIFATTYMIREWNLPKRQILLHGEGEWWLTLDYRNGDVPCVTWLDVQSEEDFIIAPNFDLFLDGLLLNETHVDPETCDLIR